MKSISIELQIRIREFLIKIAAIHTIPYQSPFIIEAGELLKAIEAEYESQS